MSEKITPPTPWTTKHCRIYDADGDEIAVATRASPAKRNMAERTAALIVDSVNAIAITRAKALSELAEADANYI